MLVVVTVQSEIQRYCVSAAKALPLLHLHVSVSSADVSVVLSLVLRYQKAAEESNAEKKKVRTQSACSFANPM